MTVARYQRSGLAAEALRRALRQQISSRQYGSMPSGLNDKQRAGLQTTVQKRLAGLQKNQPGLDTFNPAFKERFLGIRNKLNERASANKPASKPVSANKPDPFVPPAHVKINPNGQLDLPYDAGMSQAMLNAQQQSNDALMQIQMQKQQQDMEYGQLKRDADINYQDLARQTLNKHAAGGAAFSSAYGQGVAQNAQQYNNYTNDLDQADALFEQGVITQRGGIETRLNDLLRQWAFDRAQNLEGQAGDLGYGRSAPKTSYNNPKVKKPKPKPKPKKKPAPKKKARR